MVEPTPKRWPELDWLRVLAVLVLLGFHSGMMFVSWEWHIKSPETSAGLEAVMVWLHVWRMPLLLFVAGAGTFHALGFRRARAFLGERTRRLVVPLLFGMLVVVPPQIYVERIDRFPSFWAFYPTVFQFVPFPMGGSLSWHHLWFVLYLFVYSAILLPAFLWLRGARADRLFDRLEALCRRWFAPGLLLVPLLLSQLALRPYFPRQTHSLVDDWAYFAYYGHYFLAGFVCARDERIWALLRERRRRSLVLAILALIPFYAASYSSASVRVLGLNLLYSVPAMVVAWLWVLAAAGYGQAWLRRDGPILRYAAEATYPFYVLHQTVIVLVGYQVLRWEAGLWTSFLAVLLLSFLITLGLYHLAIRPFGPLRFLFGMKPRRRAEVIVRDLRPAMDG